ncbi:MAG: hypothetical protein ABW123_11630 [Cystobacter sp.]
MQVDPAHLEKTFTLIERGPVTFVAAFFALSTISLLALLLRVLTQQKTEVKELLNAERERAIKQELVAAGFLRMVRMGALVVRKGNPKNLQLDDEETLSALEPEAPTVSTLKPGGTDGAAQ